MDPNTGQQLGVFFQGTSPIGFTNALGIVKAGFVFAGSVFTASSSSPAANGGLLVIDSSGHLVTTLINGTNGPWGLAIHEQGKNAQLFISNVLDGTVTRIEVSFDGGFSTVGSPIIIASGYAFGPDSAGLVVGPAGLAYDSKKDLLYVAAEADNAIYAIAAASAVSSGSDKGTLIFSDTAHLHGPLGLLISPNGDLVTANADPAAHVDPTQPSEIVEFTIGGSFLRQYSIDPNTGSSFAILNVAAGNANEFAYVDDFSSILNIVRLSK
jgi:DNA-binding beta-propeller fold protein YncE